MVLKEEITPEASTRGSLFFPKLNLIYLAAKNKRIPISSFLFSFPFLSLRRTKRFLLELLKQFSSKNQWRRRGAGSDSAAFGTAACTGLEQSPCGTNATS